MRGGERREGERVVERLLRLVEAVERDQRHADVVPDARVRRVDARGRAQDLEGLVGTAHVHQHLPAIGERRGPAGSRLRGAREGLLGAREVAAVRGDHSRQEQRRRACSPAPRSRARRSPTPLRARPTGARRASAGARRRRGPARPRGFARTRRSPRPARRAGGRSCARSRAARVAHGPRPGSPAVLELAPGRSRASRP